ncbi:MAG: linear amide C-N hydrolase [Acidobacteria bacterium]|nr:linear amide C-N hydrolase [Acidobacteriota bacterium]
MKKIISLVTMAVFIVLVSFASNVFACSAFYLQDDTTGVLGRNLDVGFSEGSIFVNLRAQRKQSIISPYQWSAKYGSVTFNLFGIGFPVGGMNEAGLVVEHLHLGNTKYPPVDQRPGILEFEWIQYMLDTCESVSQVVAASEKIRISPDRIGMHFLICDRGGDTALFEFLDGQLIVTPKKEFLKQAAITNDAYAYSIKQLRDYQGFGGSKPIPYKQSGSLERFVVVADQINKYGAKMTDEGISDYSFSILDSVNSGTLLSVIYNSADKKLTYKTRKNSNSRTIDLKSIDFTYANESIMIDMHDNRVSPGHFNKSSNTALIRKVIPGNKFLNLEKHIDKIIDYPDAIGNKE